MRRTPLSCLSALLFGVMSSAHAEDVLIKHEGITLSATLPITMRRKPVRPWVESAIQSIPCCLA